MFDKTQKRSLFVRIAFVLFAVALAFCSVSVALNEGKYKAEAAGIVSPSYNSSSAFNFYIDPVPLIYRQNSNSSLNWTFSYYTFQVTKSGDTLTGLSFASAATTTLSQDSLYYYAVELNNANRFTMFYVDYLSDFASYIEVPVSAYHTSLSSSEVPFITPVFALTDQYLDFIYEFPSYKLHIIVPDPSSVEDIPFTIEYFGAPYDTYSPNSQETITESVTDVWTSIFTWLTTSVNSLLGILYINGELTILGVLVVMSLGISIFFLLLAVVSNFFHLRS